MLVEIVAVKSTGWVASKDPLYKKKILLVCGISVGPTAGVDELEHTKIGCWLLFGPKFFVCIIYTVYTEKRRFFANCLRVRIFEFSSVFI